MRDRGNRNRGASVEQVKKIVSESTAVSTGLPQYETAAEDIATQATGAEDAWTTVSAGAPTGARMAIVQFEAYSNDDTDDYTISWRTENGAQEVKAMRIDPSATADSSDQNPIVWYFVPLTGTGQFDYNVTSTAGALNWTIRRLGYWQ